MFKTARLSFLSIAVILVLALALVFLYLLQRQEIYENIKQTNQKLVEKEIQYFDQSTTKWSSTLKNLLRHNNFRLYINAFAKRKNIEVYKQQLQKVFNEISSHQVNQFRYIRFIDAEGNEQVVSKNSKTFTELRNLADASFFRQAITTQTGNLTKAVFESWKDNAFIHQSIPVVANNKRLGILSITIDVKNVLSRYDYLLSVNITDAVAFVNRQGKVLYHFGDDNFDKNEAELVMGVINQNSATTPLMEYQQNIWSVVRNKSYKFSVLFVSKGKNITAFLNSEYQKLAIVYAVSSLFLMFFVFSSTRKIQRQRGEVEKTKVVTKQRSHNFASISDELRRPINTLLGSLVTLSETKLNDQQKNYADTAKKSADFLLELVHEFQDYSKITDGEFNLENIEFDLRSTVHDIAELISAQAYKKGLEVSCLVGSDVPKRVSGDATRLRQVLINLLSYAVHYTDNGEVSLCISAEEHSQNSKYIVIDISDTGSLVDQQTMYQQITMFSENDFDGEYYSSEGLGLALSKQIIELMAGEISLRQNNLGGNTIQIRLPMPVIEVVSQAKSKQNLNDKRILIVGEIENNRNALSQAFAHWGMSGATMAEFERVVNVLRDAIMNNKGFDVCLIDVSLTSSSEKAFDLVRQIRKEYDADELALVTLTAQGVPGDARRAKELGIQAYLTKPVSRENMHDAILRIFNVGLSESAEIVTKHSLKEGKQQNVQRILVAEQDEIMNKQLVKYFNNLGVLVDVASEGRKAEIAIKDNVYDAVLLSTTLPGLNTFKFVKDFRKLESSFSDSMKTGDSKTIRMPIVGMIKQNDTQIAEKCRNNGMDGVIYQPIEAAKLKTFIEQYLYSNLN